jgi:hypothetical protein
MALEKPAQRLNRSKTQDKEGEKDGTGEKGQLFRETTKFESGKKVIQ